jgi:hypothetical protein
VNLRAIRTELARRCGGRGFTLYDTLPGDAELPAIAVGWPAAVRFTATLAGGAEIDDLPIIVVFGRADDERAQELLDELLSSDLIDAIRDAPSSLWVEIDVNEARNIGTTKLGATEVLTCELPVQLHTLNS